MTTIPIELQNAFYAGKRSDLVKFIINDAVVITSGENEGCRGAIISIEEVEPEVVYLFERGDSGASFLVPQRWLKRLNGEGWMQDRKMALQELIEYRKKLSEIHEALAAYEWDLEEELVQLERRHVVRVLQRFMDGDVSSDEIEEWANLIECRDDIGYHKVAEVLHILANPVITEELTHELAVRLINELKEHNTPLEPSR